LVSAQASVSLRSLPPIDLESLEPAVGKQLAGAIAAVSELTMSGGGGTAELGESFGELGQLFHAYQLNAAAIVAYDNAQRLLPADHRWPHLLARVLELEGRPEEATLAYRRAVELEPRDAAALVYLGDIALEGGENDVAGSWYSRALAIEPESSAALARLGQIASSERDFATAISHLEKALALAPEANRLHYQLAMAYRGLGDRKSAERHLALAGPVGVRPFDPVLEQLEARRTGERVHLLRGRAAFRAGRFTDAATEFTAAVAASPESVRARINLAAALAGAGDAASAESQLRETLRLDPGAATAHFNLGQLLLHRGDAVAARPHLAAAVAAQPGDAAAQLALADTLRRLGEDETALGHYRTAIALDGDDEEARLRYAATLIDLGRFDAARTALEEAVRALPRQGRLALALSRVLASSPRLDLRDGERALALALEVFRASPDSGTAAAVALALAELGRCEEAATWQLQALEMPATTASRQDLLRYESERPCRP
jgi:tetratricopeptide (TPR) repeat protein